MFDTLKAAQAARSTFRSRRLAPPVRGLVRNENLAQSKPAGAYVLENFFPTATGIVTRRGKVKHATISANAVTGMMTYIMGGAAKLFAANSAGIYDVTTPVSPTTPGSAASGIGTVTNGDFSSVQFSTSGGDFLLCVNGENLHKVYNGSAWAENSPAITGTTSDQFLHVWSYKSRLFFIKKNSLKFCYLPSGVIGGAATTFDLGPILSKGGNLISGATWSTDAGSATNEYCVFITSEGEVAVYAGDDPSSASAWTLQGVFRIGKPLGKKAMFRAGGDLAIATRDGIIPISAAYAKAVDALKDSAVSKAIEELWTEYTSSRDSLPWHVQTFTDRNSMLWVAPPTIAGQQAIVLVANMRTGAWTIFTGYNVRSMASVSNKLFVGDDTGVIYQAETGGTDNGVAFTARAAGLWDDLGAPMEQKRVTMLRGTFRSNLPTFKPEWSIGTDYTNSFSAAPSSGADVPTALWGSSVWGDAVWGGGNSELRTSQWSTVEGNGHMISWQLQMTVGNVVEPDIELASVGVIYEVGETLA